MVNRLPVAPTLMTIEQRLTRSDSWIIDPELDDRAHPARMPRVNGTTTQRGYGSTHRRARLAHLAHLRLNPGLPCWRCGQPMYYEQRAQLDLGHDDHDRTKYRGLEHAGRCNRSAAATKGNRARGQRRHPAPTAQPAYIDGRGRW